MAVRFPAVADDPRLVPLSGLPPSRGVCHQIGVATSGLGVLRRLDRQFPSTIAS